MYNEDFVQLIIEKHGPEQAAIFCELESQKNAIIVEEFKELKIVPYDEYIDVAYERDWWAERAHKLKTQNS